jgi:hypothetical protein
MHGHGSRNVPKLEDMIPKKNTLLGHVLLMLTIYFLTYELLHSIASPGCWGP